jgi:hypothetical protein
MILLTRKRQVSSTVTRSAPQSWCCRVGFIFRPIVRIGWNAQVPAPQSSARLFDFELHWNNGLGREAPPLDLRSGEKFRF